MNVTSLSVICGEGRTDRVLRCFRILAKKGSEASLELALEWHKIGRATKDKYARAPLWYRTDTEGIRSDNRDKVQ